MPLKYEIKRELSLTGLANPRMANLSLSEVNKRGCRVIGGDKGDLEFGGYSLDAENKKTILDSPVLVTTIEPLSEDEAFDIASEILMCSFDSIGLETIEHS